MSRHRRLVGAVAWLLVLGSAAVALQLSGGGALAGPPLREPGRWTAWLTGRDPVIAAFALIRIAAIVAAWYLAAVTAAGVLLRLGGAVRMVAVADRFTIAPVRRILAGTAGLGLAASGAMAIGGPALRLPAAVAATQQATAQTTTQATQTTTRATTQAGAGVPGTVTMHQLPSGRSAPAQVPAPAPVAPAGTSSDRWTVEPGQCFWSIAEAVLTEHLGREPTDAEVVPYWRRLIEANRNELAHRDNPDLVFPGQLFAVPAP